MAEAVLLVPSAPDDPVAYDETHKMMFPTASGDVSALFDASIGTLL